MTHEPDVTPTGYQSFAEIYVDLYSQAKKQITKIVKDKNLAEDLTQDTFEKVLRNIEKFKPQKGNPKDLLRRWVSAIAKNTTINYFRRKNIETNYFPFNTDENLFLTPVSKKKP